MTLANTDSSVTLTFRVREQVTPAMSRMEAGLNRVGATAGNVGKVLGKNAIAMVGVGSAMVAGAGAATQLAVKFGLLSEEQGKSAASFVQGAGAVVAIVGGISQLGVLLAAIGPSLGITALGMSGLAAAATAAAIPIAAVALTVASLIRQVKDPSNPLLSGFLPGAGTSVRAPSAVRGVANTPIQQLAGQAGGKALNVTISTFAATESELRTAAKTLGRILQEESRIGGFQIN